MDFGNLLRYQFFQSSLSISCGAFEPRLGAPNGIFSRLHLTLAGLVNKSEEAGISYPYVSKSSTEG